MVNFPTQLYTSILSPLKSPPSCGNWSEGALFRQPKCLISFKNPCEPGHTHQNIFTPNFYFRALSNYTVFPALILFLICARKLKLFSYILVTRILLNFIWISTVLFFSCCFFFFGGGEGGGGGWWKTENRTSIIHTGGWVGQRFLANSSLCKKSSPRDISRSSEKFLWFSI